MAMETNVDERRTLIDRDPSRPRQRVSGDAATEYFEEGSRDASARRRSRAIAAFALAGALFAAASLTTSVVARRGALGGAPKPVWTPNLPLEQVNTPALAFAEMDQVRLEGAALDAAKADSYENSFPSFSSDRYFTVGGNRDASEARDADIRHRRRRLEVRREARGGREARVRANVW